MSVSLGSNEYLIFIQAHKERFSTIDPIAPIEETSAHHSRTYELLNESNKKIVFSQKCNDVNIFDLLWCILSFFFHAYRPRLNFYFGKQL